MSGHDSHSLVRTPHARETAEGTATHHPPALPPICGHSKAKPPATSSCAEPSGNLKGARCSEACAAACTIHLRFRRRRPFGDRFSTMEAPVPAKENVGDSALMPPTLCDQGSGAPEKKPSVASPRFGESSAALAPELSLTVNSPLRHRHRTANTKPLITRWPQVTPIHRNESTLLRWHVGSVGGGRVGSEAGRVGSNLSGLAAPPSIPRHTQQTANTRIAHGR